MAKAEQTPMPAFRDDRGTLVAIEFSEVPFDVRRIFSVVGPVGGSTRGAHSVDCNELIILTGGSARVRLGVGAADIVLDTPGQTLAILPGTYLEYDLIDEHSSIMVLADRPHPATGMGQ